MTIDDVRGIEMATEYLISKGHRKILYFGHPERVEGYVRTMAAHGLSPLTDRMTDIDLTTDTLQAHIRTAKPTAILTVAKYSEKMVSLLNRMGMRFPEDISLIVYDDVDWTKMLDITTVAHPLDELAEIVCKNKSTLSKYENGEISIDIAPPHHRSLLPHLKYRGSVTSPN